MKPFAAILAIIVALCWGFNFAASKFTVLHFPAIFTIFLRYLIVCVLLFPFVRKWILSFKQLFILTFFTITLHFTLVFSAIAYGLDLSTTVIVIQLGAPFSCILSAVFYNDKMGAWRSAGMAIAFVGVLVVAGTPNVAEHDVPFMLALAGAFAWACSNVYMKQLGQPPALALMFWTGLISLPQTLILSYLIEDIAPIVLIETAPYSAWMGLTYSAIVSTIVGYGLWYWLLVRYPVSQVTPFSLLVPIGGFASANIFFEESFTSQMLVGACVTLVGVAIITFRKPRMARMMRS